MTLDAMFGPLIAPQIRNFGPPVQVWEQDFVPASLCKLDASSAPPLLQMMHNIESGWKTGKVLTFDTIIIWLVDHAGDIWFAVEELVLDGMATGRPKHQTLPITATMPKLGHPALNNGASARIAGEVYFDTGISPPTWVINNNSGRYGRHPSRTAIHLDNVAAKFRDQGINLIPYFRSL